VGTVVIHRSDVGKGIAICIQPLKIDTGCGDGGIGYAVKVTPVGAPTGMDAGATAGELMVGAASATALIRSAIPTANRLGLSPVPLLKRGTL
jgi:hypothetical protein